MWRLWSLAVGSVVQTLDLGPSHHHVGWAKDGALLETGHGSGPLNYYELSSGRRLPTMRVPMPERYGRFVWSPGRKLLVWHDHRGLYVWDPAAERIVAQAAGPAGPLAWSPDGKQIACLADQRSNTVVLLDVPGLTVQRSLTSFGDVRMGWIHWDAKSGHLFAAACGDPRNDHTPKIVAFDTSTWQTVFQVQVPHCTGAPRFALAPDRSQFVLGSNQALHFFDTGGKPLKQIYHPVGTLSAARWLPDGRHLLLVYDTMARLWDLQQGRPVRTYLPVGETGGVGITDEGHILSAAGVVAMRDLVYVVLAEGEIALRTPSEMASKHGWRNNPKSVGF